jgi:hypothetical protein
MTLLTCADGVKGAAVAGMRSRGVVTAGGDLVTAPLRIGILGAARIADPDVDLVYNALVNSRRPRRSGGGGRQGGLDAGDVVDRQRIRAGRGERDRVLRVR